MATDKQAHSLIRFMQPGWRGVFIVSAPESGLRVDDTVTRQRLSRCNRPKGGPPHPAHLAWFQERTTRKLEFKREPLDDYSKMGQ